MYVSLQQLLCKYIDTVMYIYNRYVLFYVIHYVMKPLCIHRVYKYNNDSFCFSILHELFLYACTFEKMQNCCNPSHRYFVSESLHITG